MRKRVLLDSGAFTVWRRGVSLSIDDYARFVNTTPEAFEIVVNLDVIPQSAHPSDLKASAEAGYANWTLLRDAAIDSMPVVHYRDDLSWLDRYVSEGATLIGFGGIALSGKQTRRAWLKAAFARLRQLRYEGGVHGFGMTSSELFFEFPWYSVDSSRWVRLAAHGDLLVPATSKGAWDFSKMPIQVMTSNRRESGGRLRYHRAGPAIRTAVESWLSFCGLSMEECAESRKDRIFANIRYLQVAASHADVELFFAGGEPDVLDRADESRRLISFALLPKLFDPVSFAGARRKLRR